MSLRIAISASPLTPCGFAAPDETPSVAAISTPFFDFPFAQYYSAISIDEGGSAVDVIRQSSTLFLQVVE